MSAPETSKPFQNLKRFSRTSLARILPALFVAFLPFGQFDDGLLSSLYTLRGKQFPTRLVTYSYSSIQELQNISNRLKESRANFKCFYFLQQEIQGLEKCQSIMIEDFYSDDLTQQNYTEMQRHLGIHTSIKSTQYLPLFYGGIGQFNVASVQEKSLDSQANQSNNPQTIAFIPSQSESKVRVLTPVGKLAAVEVGLNVLGNAIENKSMLKASHTIQVIGSLLTAVIAVFILYSYPIFMTLILILAIGASELALGALVFDRFSLQLPLAGPLCILIVTYLLGMSDRLDRRERREWRLEQESDNLKRLDEMRNNFLSLVSHDLKTPIAKMQSSLDRILRGDFGVLSTDQHSHILKIIDANGSLQRSISTLLLLSRVETRELHVQFQPCDLPKLLEDIAKAHEASASDRNIAIETDFEPMFLVNLDEALIREVANNLIDNAMKYSPSGSRIFLRCGEQGNCPELLPPQAGVWFEVQDQGPGIDLVDRKKVFQKFVRGSNENSALDQSIKGTGLGLFLTRFFVEEHNGVASLISKTKDEKIHPIDIASQYFQAAESGTVFRVVLPIEQPETVESL